MTDPMTGDELRRAVDEIGWWYHTIELAPGVETPGWFDNRPALGEIPFPKSLAGKRCLDVGTYDGFWAFAMERRGAAEVLAIDVIDPEQWEWPAGSEEAVKELIGSKKSAGRGFEIAKAALDSKVERRELSVYDLDPDDVGLFDFVYVGSLLLHLRDPIGALMKVRAICRDQLVLVDAIDLALTAMSPLRPAANLDGSGRPWWWKPNVAALTRMVEAAGFTVVVPPRRLYMKPGRSQPTAMPSARQLLTPDGRLAAITHLKGDPHAALLARVR